MTPGRSTRPVPAPAMYAPATSDEAVAHGEHGGARPPPTAATPSPRPARAARRRVTLRARAAESPGASRCATGPAPAAPWRSTPAARSAPSAAANSRTVSRAPVDEQRHGGQPQALAEDAERRVQREGDEEAVGPRRSCRTRSGTGPPGWPRRRPSRRWPPTSPGRRAPCARRRGGWPRRRRRPPVRHRQGWCACSSPDQRRLDRRFSRGLRHARREVVRRSSWRSVRRCRAPPRRGRRRRTGPSPPAT